MEAQLLVCDRISFDPERKQHELGYVYNMITVPTMPWIVPFSVFVKVLNMDRTNEVNASIRIVDAQERIVSYTNPYVLRNHRDEDQIYGVDTHIGMAATVSIPGIIRVILFLDDEPIVAYPLTIRVAEPA